MKNINEIRNIFISYFIKKKHFLAKSSSLISNTKDLLFTNSGMNQFKFFFYNNNNIKYKKLVNCQRCLRVGGKYNDLNNIGFSNKHNTFFEMLGNFSFNDYFKEESIYMAWEFLTNKNWLNLNKKKIIITIYYNDIESELIWKKIGISNCNLIKIKDKNNIKYNSDNFWKISYFGLCGPSTEIYYDLGNNFYGNINNEGNFGERYLELWNIVFIQFYNNKNNNLKKLKFNSVDTGMGLERITSIVQNVYSNYKIFFFKNLINITKEKFNINNINNININLLYLIVDHIRTIIFIINDGILPSNEKHGYILRKIIRRLYCNIRSLGIKEPFIYNFVDIYINYMINYYEILNINNIDYIKNIILKEELNFINIIDLGLNILKKEIYNNIDINNYINDKFIHKLHDTYGLPFDIIYNFCIFNNININKNNINKWWDDRVV